MKTRIILITKEIFSYSNKGSVYRLKTMVHASAQNGTTVAVLRTYEMRYIKDRRTRGSFHYRLVYINTRYLYVCSKWLLNSNVWNMYDTLHFKDCKKSQTNPWIIYRLTTSS